MRWATVILGAIVAAAVGWAVTAGPYHQSAEVAATIAGVVAAIVIAAGTKWANNGGDRSHLSHRLEDGITGADYRSQDAKIFDSTGVQVGSDNVLHIHQHIYPAPEVASPVAVVVGDVPAQAVAWQGRVELLDRLTVMAGQARTVVVCAVTGQRGIGKTQLAAAYARARVAEGWPVVVWVVADNLANLINGLAALAEAAGVRAPDADPSDAARAALAWLRAHPGPCLLVYDNALDPELIQGWIPTVGAVHTVITTTRHDFENLGEALDVTLFTLDEASTYLRVRTALDDDTGAAQLAEQLGRLPLALACAGAVIGARRRYRTYQAYLDRLATVSIAELLPRPAGHPYPHGAAEAILLALDDLAANDADGHARALLDRLAVLAPTGVDAALLDVLSHDDTAAAILAERSLTMPTTDSDRTVVHRLVQRVVCDHNQRLGCLNSILIDAADLLDIVTRAIDEQWTSRTRIADYAEHAEQLANQPTEEAATRRLVTLRLSMMYWLVRVHDLPAAIRLGETLVTDCERVLGPDHPDTLTSRNNLAYAYRSVGRLDEAITLYQATFADRERVLGPDHPHTLTSRHNLASVYEAIGRLDEAIILHQATLADHVRVLGPDHPDTLRSRNNLAYAYRSAGRLDEAIILHQATLADHVRVLGPDHPHTLTSRNNLAGVYEAMGRLDEAVTLIQSVLADHERVLGPDHPHTLRSRNNLAGVYEAMGRLDEAITLYRNNLAYEERALGSDHPDTLASRNHLAHAHRKARRHDEAITLYWAALVDYERVLGPDHPDTLRSRNNLAYAYRSVGRLDEAIALHQVALADYERVLGPDHPHTVTSRNNLADAYRAAGRVADAERLLPVRRRPTEA